MTNPACLNAINYGRSQINNLRKNGDNNLWLVYDALVFSWQNSKIVQKGKKLCCPTISRIAELSNVSTRTVLRKIKILEQMGLINSFAKRLRDGTVRRFFNVCIDKINNIIETCLEKPKTEPQASIHAGSDKLSPRQVTNCQPHIYKEKIEKEENNNNKAMGTIERNRVGDEQQSVTVNSLAIAQVDVLVTDTQSGMAVNLEDQIGDSLTTRQGCRINGAINNLIRKESVRISDPKGLKTQVAFKILLKSDKSGRDNFQHQLNAAMKLIREGKWSTPHGYYNHSDEGGVVKTATGQQEKQWKELKRQECQSGGFAALAAACRVGDQVNITTNSKVDIAPVPNLPKQTMTSTDRVMIDGQLVLESDAKARLDSINESIARHLERARSVPDHLRGVLMGVVARLREGSQVIESKLHLPKTGICDMLAENE